MCSFMYSVFNLTYCNVFWYFCVIFYFICSYEVDNFFYLYGEFIQHSRKEKKNDNASQERRIWSKKEEQTLIIAFYDMIAQWWKCDVPYKAGYANVLEKHLVRALPDCNLKAVPHIDSKVKHWKKKIFNSLWDACYASEINFNDTTNELDIESEQMWEDYCKVTIIAFNLYCKKIVVLYLLLIFYWFY